MILEAINKKPFIHFGFNKQQITANVNEVITVWQDTLYVREIQTEQPAFKLAKPTKNNNNFTISFDAVGEYEYKLDPTNAQSSNTLKINVI
jgi:hypothetical protein